MKATVNGITLGYDDIGSGPAVVLLHDFPLSRRMWEPQIAPLVAAGYRVIVPDLRGFGESSEAEAACDISVYADDVVALLNYLGIGRAVFGGIETRPERQTRTQPVSCRRSALLHQLHHSRSGVPGQYGTSGGVQPLPSRFSRQSGRIQACRLAQGRLIREKGFDAEALGIRGNRKV
jgi:hypothetical protein